MSIKDFYIINLFNFIKLNLKELKTTFRLSYLPPIMIYLAAGVSSLTSVVGIFFLKDYLNLSASFIASIAFWAGIPWALKMPLGHIIDLIWHKKSYMVLLGAFLITLSLLIMYCIIAHTNFMLNYFAIETWFIISAILAPVGYVIQDVVADAMTVDAVPSIDKKLKKLSATKIKAMHTTMQTLGRFSIILGTVLVSLINIFVFNSSDDLMQVDKVILYGKIYLIALGIPLISISGILLSNYIRNANIFTFTDSKFNISYSFVKTKPDYLLLIGSLCFVVFSLAIGTSGFILAEELVFIGSMSIITFLMLRLIKHMLKKDRYMILGTAIIIFFFRAVPGPGAGLNWFEIDILNFNEYFFSTLTLISSVFTMIGIIIFRPLIIKNSIATIVIFLSVASAILMIPSIGMFYGLHLWTGNLTNGVIDAEFIAIINTGLESPLGQVSMIPLLAWIARHAPNNMKATFFAVFASFTNLALSARELGTKYINKIFIISREVKDKTTNTLVENADYSELGNLLIIVFFITLFIPLLAIFVIQKSKFRTAE